MFVLHTIIDNITQQQIICVETILQNISSLDLKVNPVKVLEESISFQVTIRTS